MTYIKRKAVNQFELSCLDEIIADDNPVRFYRLISDKYVTANAEKFGIKDTKEAGRPEYHPSDLLCLFIYGYVNRIGSSRRLELACHYNKEVEWLLGYLRPDHWTINNFRTNHKKLIKGLIKQFTKFLRVQKLIDGNFVMIDGTKIKANNSKDMPKTAELAEVIRRGEEEITRYLDRLERTDNIEEEEERLEELRKEKEKQLKELKSLQAKTEKQKLLYKKALEEGIKYIGPTDLDSRLMLTRNGKTAAYNAQTAVDSKNHFIVGVSVTNEPVDINELSPMVKSLLSDEIPLQTVVADKGYSALDEIQQIEEETSVECVVSIKKTPNEEKDLEFSYDEQKDEYTCPMGKRLTLLQKGNKSRKDNASVYLCRECEGCPIRESCTKSERGRTINRRENEEWREAYKERMKSEENKLLIAKRKGVIEHVFGTMKLYMGAVPLLLRGIEGVGIEVDLYVQAYNFRRILNVLEFSDLMTRVAEFDWKMA
jgi:transposase